jgi:uncharacterized phage-associated protein
MKVIRSDVARWKPMANGRDNFADRLPDSEVRGRHTPPVVKLHPNHSRIREAILYILNEAEQRAIKITQYTILKTFFLADRAHLNKYGRPITFDNYSAMKDGPVANFVYDVLKHSPGALAALGLKAPLWKKIGAPEVSPKAFAYTKPARKHDHEVLSESDTDALSKALTVVSALSFTQIRKLTHEDAAYIAAWRDDGGKMAYQMSYGLLFDTPNFEKAEKLAFISRHS